MAKTPFKKKRRRIIPQKPLFESCIFCKEKKDPDYKDVSGISRFVTDRFRIVPRTRSGLCAQHQRKVATAIKRSRYLSLLSYTASL